MDREGNAWLSCGVAVGIWVCVCVCMCVRASELVNEYIGDGAWVLVCACVCMRVFVFVLISVHRPDVPSFRLPPDYFRQRSSTLYGLFITQRSRFPCYHYHVAGVAAFLKPGLITCPTGIL